MLTLVTYAANTGTAEPKFLPDGSSIPDNERWQILIQAPPAPEAAAHIIDGPPQQVLSIVNPGQQGGLFYFRFEELKLDNVIFEINCKVTSVTPALARDPFGFGFIDDERTIEAGLSAGKIFFHTPPQHPNSLSSIWLPTIRSTPTGSSRMWR